MRFKPKSFEEARQSFKPMHRSQMNRGKGIKPRFNKRPSVDGDSGKLVREDCDELIRQIIRLRDVRCFTCGVSRVHYSLIHPGHYITRKVLALRWSLANIHAQCNVCNDVHNTHPEIYRAHLVREYDEAFVLQLEFIAQQNPRVEYVDLLAIRDELRNELARLKEKAA